MPYIKRTVKAGKTVEIKKYFSARGMVKEKERQQREKPTPEDVARQNEKNAIEKLRWLLNTNFEGGDLFLTLTYDSKSAPPEPEKAKKDLEIFLRKARGIYKKAGKEFKYITVTEYEAKRIHHHLCCKRIDARELWELWENQGGHGAMRTRYFDNSGQYGELAEYLVKETKRTFRLNNGAGRKRWNASKNLTQPEIKKEVVERNSWRKDPKPIKGYWLDKGSIESGVCGIFEMPYQEYRLIKMDGRKGVRKKE